MTSSAKIAKDTLKRLRKRAPTKGPKKDVSRLRMPPSPDPWEYDEDGRKIFPWPKSFAEIVQTSVYATMNLFQEGETRVEVCFPPLPVAELDWNRCDMAETRIIDANTSHAISFSKLIIKEPRKLPKLDVEEAKRISEAGTVENPADIETLLQRRFKSKTSATNDLGRTVRVLFPSKVDSLRARDIHYEKWKNMKRPELVRRGYYNECNEDNWPGPFEDIFIYTSPQSVEELCQIRNYVEKDDAMAKRQVRVLRHVIFNCNLFKMKSDIQFYKTIAPFKPQVATPKVHFDFFSTFRNSYYIRFQKYTMATYEPPFVTEYGGSMMHTYPSPWQFFYQDSNLNYRCIEVADLRPSNRCFERKMQRGHGLLNPIGGMLPEDPTNDDVYMQRDLSLAGSIQRPAAQALMEGLGEAGLWYEGGDAFDEEISDKWRLS